MAVLTDDIHGTNVFLPIDMNRPLHNPVRPGAPFDGLHTTDDQRAKNLTCPSSNRVNFYSTVGEPVRVTPGHAVTAIIFFQLNFLNTPYFPILPRSYVRRPSCCRWKYVDEIHRGGCSPSAVKCLCVVFALEKN